MKSIPAPCGVGIFPPFHFFILIFLRLFFFASSFSAIIFTSTPWINYFLRVQSRTVCFKLKVQATAHDVLCRRKVFLRGSRLRSQSYLKQPKVVEHHAVAVLQVAVHHVHQFFQHGIHICLLRRRVFLNFYADLPDAPHPSPPHGRTTDL